MNRYETKQGKRINTILDCLNKGASYSEIQQRLTPLSGEKLGDDSVKNVEEAIKTFPFIKEIKKTYKNSKEDTVYKYDLMVSLSEKNIDVVGIQVKSSVRRCSKFRNKFYKQYDDDKQSLIEKKLIVINGQLPENTIQKIFIDQLSQIDQYHIFKTSLSREEGAL